MKKVMLEISKKKLIIACSIIWSVVFLLSIVLCIKLAGKSVEKKQSTTVVEEEVHEVLYQFEPINYEEHLDPLLIKGMKFCQKEYAVELANAVYMASEKYGIPIPVIYAVIATESCLHGYRQINSNNIMEINDKAISRYDCRGIMQISKYALAEYNKIKKTNYTMNDLYNVMINVEIGTWYFKQFERVANSYTEMYIIYNVGYSEYNKINKNWFYSWDGHWYSDIRNKWFYMNDLIPPNDGRHGTYGKNKLNDYGARKRFNICLNICENYFNS